MDSAEHVVIGEEVVEAEVLDRSPDPPHGGGVPSKLDLRVDDADLHGSSPCQRSMTDMWLVSFQA